MKLTREPSDDENSMQLLPTDPISRVVQHHRVLAILVAHGVVNVVFDYDFPYFVYNPWHFSVVFFLPEFPCCQRLRCIVILFPSYVHGFVRTFFLFDYNFVITTIGLSYDDCEYSFGYFIIIITFEILRKH